MSRRSETRRRPVLRWVVVLVLVAVSAVVLVAGWAAWQVRSSASEAQVSLTRALAAIKDDDRQQAEQHLTEARAAVDEADRASRNWALGTVAPVPVAGTAVDDLRLLVGALGDVTHVADQGLDLLEMVSGPKSALMSGERVDLATLRDVIDLTHGTAEDLAHAQTSLEAVEGTTPVVGSLIAEKRDAALAEVEPMARTYDEALPVLEQLPAVLGDEGRRDYLLTMLNPAELRYSGGATLSLAPMEVHRGRIRLGESYNLGDFYPDQLFLTWEPVAGNPFHTRPEEKLGNATFSPEWPVSAEELLRAWEARSDDELDGLVAIDLPGLASLLRVTGPIEVAGYGELNGDNLVSVLAGSYDTFESQEERHDLNDAIIPVFKEKLFSAGHMSEKVTTLRNAAAGRHFVVYFRDEATQSAMADLGLTGSLNVGEHDYLGVFSQNVNGSKVDIAQERAVRHVVRLREDGSARVRVTVRTTNATQPLPAGVTDEKFGYFTRWSRSKLAFFLPPDATGAAMQLNGRRTRVELRRTDEFTWTNKTLMLRPGGTSRLALSYDVPAAAVVDGDDLTYGLATDPQGLVRPQTMEIEVVWPDGYEVADLPEGWEGSGATATWTAEDLARSEAWQLRATR